MAIQTISEEQLVALTARMEPHNRAACYLMFYCGLRVGELKSFRVSGNTLVVKGKGGKIREVIVPSKVRQSDLDGPIQTNPVRVFESLKRRAREIGLDWVHPHTLRHSYATNLLDAGFNIREVQTLLGHSNLSTTQIYTHTDLSRIEEKYRKLGML